MTRKSTHWLRLTEGAGVCGANRTNHSNIAGTWKAAWSCPLIALAANPIVVVAVEAMRVRRQDRETPEADVSAVEVGRVWRNARGGIRRVTVRDGRGGNWKRRCAFRPRPLIWTAAMWPSGASWLWRPIRMASTVTMTAWGVKVTDGLAVIATCASRSESPWRNR